MSLDELDVGIAGASNSGQDGFEGLHLSTVEPHRLGQLQPQREAALALPNETFVPVDATITGFVEQAVVGDRDLAKNEELTR